MTLYDGLPQYSRGTPRSVSPLLAVFLHELKCYFSHQNVAIWFYYVVLLATRSGVSSASARTSQRTWHLGCDSLKQGVTEDSRSFNNKSPTTRKSDLKTSPQMTIESACNKLLSAIWRPWGRNRAPCDFDTMSVWCKTLI